MPQPKSISPGKGREALRLKVQIFRLKILSASKFHKQTFFKLGPSGKIPANYTNSVQFAHTVREFCKIRTIRLTYYTLCFRHLPRQRTLQNSSELRKFCTIHPHSPRITRNSPFCQLILYYVSGTCPDRERSGIPVNYANSV